MSDRDRRTRNVETLINRNFLLIGCSNRMILFRYYLFYIHVLGLPIEKNEKVTCQCNNYF